MTTNTITFETLKAEIAELGRQAGEGKDTQIKFDLKVFEASYQGKLDLQPNKHAPDVDDATKLAEIYATSQNKSVIFDAKAPNQQKLTATVRTAIKIGGYTKGGTNEPLATCNNLVNLRQDLKKKGTKGLEDPHNMFLRWARQQLKRDKMIEGDELKAFCYKPVTELRSAEEVLRSIQKIATNLTNGKVSNCPDLDNSPEVKSIITACNTRITKIVQARTGNTQPQPPVHKVAP